MGGPRSLIGGRRRARARARLVHDGHPQAVANHNVLLNACVQQVHLRALVEVDPRPRARGGRGLRRVLVRRRRHVRRVRIDLALLELLRGARLGAPAPLRRGRGVVSALRIVERDGGPHVVPHPVCDVVLLRGAIDGCCRGGRWRPLRPLCRRCPLVGWHRWIRRDRDRARASLAAAADPCPSGSSTGRGASTADGVSRASPSSSLSAWKTGGSSAGTGPVGAAGGGGSKSSGRRKRKRKLNMAGARACGGAARE